MGQSIRKVLGIGAATYDMLPPPEKANRAPTTSDTDYPKGMLWVDESASPNAVYTHLGGGDWDSGGNAPATNTVYGLVKIDTDTTLASADDEHVPTTLAIKTYADNLAIAGAPDASESVKGIAELATQAETIAYTDDERIVTPLKLGQAFAAPPAMGSGTPAAGSFTTLAATGAVNFDAGGSWESGGTAIDIGADADTAAINVGTGAAARVITIGNVSGATQLVLNAGTAGIALASTGAGDITINSDDTLLLDADGVLELNSSAGVISIGNDADANDINIGTGAAARTITVGNGTGATQIDLDAGTGGINVGTNAIAHTVTIGNMTGATALALEVGTGNFTLNGVGASTYTIGAATTTGTISIGGTAQTGTFTLGGSTGAMTMNIANADGKKTINIGDGVDGNDIDIGNGANTSAQTIDIANGASAANSTVNILSGNGSAGTQTLNVLDGTRAGALNLATGAAAHVIAVGSSSAGAVTVDTAAGISLDAATASNFTVTGAADLSLISTAGSIIINAEEAVTDAIDIQTAAGGIDINAALEINIDSSEAAVADAIRIVASAADGGIDIDSGTGGITIDSTGALSLDAGGASNFNVTGATNDLTLGSAGGRVIVDAGEDAADAIYLHANAGTSETIRLHSDLGTGVDSIHLESDVGGVTLESGLASADAINLVATNGGVDVDGALQINIASSQAAASAIVLNASDASGGIQLTTGGGLVDVTASDLAISGAGKGLQIETGAATDMAGTATLTNGVVTVSNTNIATGDYIFMQMIDDNSSTTLGQLQYTISNGTSFTVTSVQNASPGSTETGDQRNFAYFIIRPL